MQKRTTALPITSKGAIFSPCREFRYALWRIWDASKPFAMFVGLNPSTADGADNDNTIDSVTRICESNGCGGFYMMNCFAHISTKPEGLKPNENGATNDRFLVIVGSRCKFVVFAWGAFPVVLEHGRHIALTAMFPGAKALHINKGGSPKHPLYCKGDSAFIDWQLKQDTCKKNRKKKQ